jgi:hypothetical protein
MNNEQIKILNESIINIKMLCKQYDLCMDCPMYENCNFMPRQWSQLEEGGAE